MSIDSQGRRSPDTLRITIRPDAVGGISLGHGRDLMPGETGDVPYAIAIGALAAGRATMATDAIPAAPPAPGAPGVPPMVESRDPIVESRDPVSAPPRRGRTR